MSKDDHLELDLDLDRMDGMLRKAKRKSLWRQMGISLLAAGIVLIGGIWARGYLLNEGRVQMERDLGTMKRITQPNVEYMPGTTVSEGLFRNTVQYRSYKLIEGQPVKWEDQLYEYSMWRTFHPLNVSIPIERDRREPHEAHIAFNVESAQREMRFYLPTKEYPYYPQDMIQLAPKADKVAELAISFDKPYTVDQIGSMLPNGVHVQWYWVDTYYEQDDAVDQHQSPEYAGAVYGFRALDGAEKEFLSAVQEGLRSRGRYQEEFQRIYDYLRAGKSEATEQDIRILGIVVTGQTRDLQLLKGLPFVRAAVQGAMTEKM
jgi:hypothetical protein